MRLGSLADMGLSHHGDQRQTQVFLTDMEVAVEYSMGAIEMEAGFHSA